MARVKSVIVGLVAATVVFGVFMLFNKSLAVIPTSLAAGVGAFLSMDFNFSNRAILSAVFNLVASFSLLLSATYLRILSPELLVGGIVIVAAGAFLQYFAIKGKL